jgi:TPR repeat protein
MRDAGRLPNRGEDGRGGSRETAQRLVRRRNLAGLLLSLACFYWAEAQLAPTAVAPSEAESAEILRAYESACRGRSAAASAACAQLDFIELAAAKSSDAALAPVAHLSRACDNGKGASCCALAEVYRDGRFVPPDPASAASARLKACALTQQSCCVPGAP